MGGLARRRIGSRVTAVSWIPSEAVSGVAGRAAFASLGHYDDPLPDRIDGDRTSAQRQTLDAWREADRFRFANQLGAWIDVENRQIVDAGYDGGGLIGSTRLGAGAHGVTFGAFAMPLLRSEPQFGGSDGGEWARFTQTWGGRTGVPAPRRVNRRPYVQLRAPLAWSTLTLTIHSDGRSTFEVAGASAFPRHWIYGTDGALAAKTGTTDYKHWYRMAFGRHTPWGDTDTPAFVTAAETALERQLSSTIMREGRHPALRRLGAGAVLTEQGDPVAAHDAELFLVLDGVLSVAVDGVVLAEIGPGAVVGERAVLEGTRTSTLCAVTPCRIAVAAVADIDLRTLRALSTSHRREQTESP